MNLLKTNFEPGNKQALAIGVAVILFFYFLFENFFSSTGRIGDDYSFFLPQLLDGNFWYHNNGLFSLQWFTPAFGGGLPKFPNPQGVYYSAEQFLSFVTDPLTAVKLTLLLFGTIGFAGCYLLLRNVFSVSSSVSLLGATIFLFNGFYVHRMIIGHITFHPFMLYPLFIFFILRNSQSEFRSTKTNFVSDVVLSSIIFIYMIHSGAFYVVPPLILTTLIVAIIYDFSSGSVFVYKRFIFKIFFVFLLSISASAAQLNSSFSFISFFPRDLYKLPGVPGISDLFVLCFRALFLSSPSEFAKQILVNRVWDIGPHEMEFGVGIVPLIILVAGIPFALKYFISEKKWQNVSLGSLVKTAIIIFLFLVPLALNFYTPSWNAFLKSLPFIKSSSSNFRWFCCYIPVVIVIACLIVEKNKWMNHYKFSIALLGIIYVIAFNIFRDRTFYHNQSYSPKIILEADRSLKSGKLKPLVEYVDESVLKDNDTIFGGDVLALGSSQLRPYEPVFGYRLENFPKKTLVSGKLMQVNADGRLNIKNPASYVFPQENNCNPGDHFTVEETEKAEKFRHYRKFPFNIPARQSFANALSLISLSGILLFLIFSGTTLLFRKLIPSKIKLAAGHEKNLRAGEKKKARNK